MNTIIQIFSVFLSSDAGHWANNVISSTSGADYEDDEEVVFPLDWYVVFEYKCEAT